jgi:hypothetical protein
MAVKATKYSEGLLGGNGLPLVGIAYQVLISGTSTAATVFADEDKTAVITTPVTNAFGNAVGFLDPDFYYDIKVGTSAQQPLQNLGPSPSEPAEYVSPPPGGIVFADLSTDVVERFTPQPTITIDGSGHPVLHYAGVKWGINADGHGYYRISGVVPANEAAVLVPPRTLTKIGV